MSKDKSVSTTFVEFLIILGITILMLWLKLVIIEWQIEAFDVPVVLNRLQLLGILLGLEIAFTSIGKIEKVLSNEDTVGQTIGYYFGLALFFLVYWGMSWLLLQIFS